MTYLYGWLHVHIAVQSQTVPCLAYCVTDVLTFGIAEEGVLNFHFYSNLLTSNFKILKYQFLHMEQIKLLSKN